MKLPLRTGSDQTQFAQKKEGCLRRGEDSPMSWFLYNRSLWMMKRPKP
jgi:hypothetical protein